MLAINIKQKISLTFLCLFISLKTTVLADDIYIAVRANKGNEAAVKKWQATADHLKKAIPEHNFFIVPFENNSALNQAVSQKKYSFILTNPASAVEHQIRYDYQPLATLLNKRHDQGYAVFGSVIFTRTDRLDISEIADLKNKTFIGVDELGFGGWRVAWYEILKHGINPYTDFKELRFAGGKQQDVVYAVLNGDADAGSVRTDMLERMAAKGKIQLQDLKILGLKRSDDFTFLHSTDLYPEWLFSASKYTDDKLKSKVTVTLLSIDKNDLAAKKGKYIGWISPRDYSSVDKLLKELHVGPYHHTHTNIFSEFIEKYALMLSLGFVFLIILIAAFIYLLKLNGRINKTQDILKDEITHRKHAEQVLTSLAEQSLEFSHNESFFNNCLTNLANLFSAKYAFIGLYGNIEQTKIQTYAVWADGKLENNFEYDLKGTPCEDAINQRIKLISENVTELYPDDKLLVEMGIESYYGSSLIAQDGTKIGLVTVMDTKPMHPDVNIRPILEIFANRITLEMQRKHEEEELQGMTKRLSFQASHDSLTELINRREFENRMNDICDSAIKEDKEHALCYLDLDQFKIVNDTSGHGAGDELLKQLSIKLNSLVRTSDTLARLGGDEFGILLIDCPMIQAQELALTILEAIQSFRFAWEDKIFEIGASIGLVPINKNSFGVYELLQAADSACYVAKDLGRNRIQVYHEDDISVASHTGELRWVTKINKALQNDKFVLYKQPINSVNSKNSIKHHYEILLRMTDDNGKLLLPGSFIIAAERYNLMYSIDKWVIENTFQYLHQHYNQQQLSQADELLYSINLSGISITQQDLMNYISDASKKYSIPPEIICFEITETAAITNFSRAVKFIEQMKVMGYSFAMDDFGTGVCSYAYLRSFPVSYLKIDGQFVIDVLDDPMNKAIIESIVHIAKVMKIKTIAEWVENKTVFDKLTELGVDFIQGYFISKPVPLSGSNKPS